MQPLWQLLRHLSSMGLNHWATHVKVSGELPALEKLTEILPPGSIVFDVGANKGDYSLAALEILKPSRIYAFEPSAAAFKSLRSTVDSEIVEPVKLALGSQPGEAILHNASPGASIGSILDLRDPFESFDPSFDEGIEVTTIDIFCDKNSIGQIGLLKIDVEGLELDVLRGAQKMIGRSAITAIQFEFGVGNIEARTYLRDYFDILGKQYAIFRIVSDGLWPLRSYNPELEYCLPINYMAVLRCSLERSPEA